ncbi:hypothetical protein GQ457_09G024910 [Hibiscus cannabinus]
MVIGKQNEETVTLYVENLSQALHWKGLWHEFGRHGDVVDAFISRKRNRRGRRFGFVRFIGRADAERATKRLNGFYLYGYKLFVSRAKFNPRTSFWRKLRQNHKFLAQNDESNEAKGSGSFEARGKNVVNQNVCQQAEPSSEESRRSLDTEQDIMYCSDCLCTAVEAQSGALDVVAKFGAKADEKTDLSKPLSDAWKEACASATPSTILIPKGVYLLSQATLEGPCKAPIEVQLQGTIKALTDPQAFKEAKWIEFNKVENFKMSGGGVFDGQGTRAYKTEGCDKKDFCSALPIVSDIEVAKGATHEKCKAISTKSEKVLNPQTENKQGEAIVTNSKVASDTDTPAPADNPASAEKDHEFQTESEEAEIATASPQSTQPRKDILEEPRPPAPSPQRLKKQKHEYQYKKFFDILKQVHINLPLVEALQQMTNYAKFLKDIVSRKTRIGEFETVAATEACLAMMHNKVPIKKIDPGNNYSCKVLCDHGASINLMPKSVFQKLGTGEAKPTTVMLQLADHSYVQPEGKIEDILVRVEKFIFLANFLILDCEADEHAPIILKRPSLATNRAMIDFEKGELGLRVDKEHVKIKKLHSPRAA